MVTVVPWELATRSFCRSGLSAGRSAGLGLPPASQLHWDPGQRLRVGRNAHSSSLLHLLCQHPEEQDGKDIHLQQRNEPARGTPKGALDGSTGGSSTPFTVCTSWLPSQRGREGVGMRRQSHRGRIGWQPCVLRASDLILQGATNATAGRHFRGSNRDPAARFPSPSGLGRAEL